MKTHLTELSENIATRIQIRQAIWEHSMLIEQRQLFLSGVRISSLMDFRFRPLRLKSILCVDVCQHAICQICHGGVPASPGGMPGETASGQMSDHYLLTPSSAAVADGTWDWNLERIQTLRLRELCRWWQFLCKLVCAVLRWIQSMVCRCRRQTCNRSIIDLNIFHRVHRNELMQQHIFRLKRVLKI